MILASALKARLNEAWKVVLRHSASSGAGGLIITPEINSANDEILDGCQSKFAYNVSRSG